jgi:hypothetical protein
MNKEEIVIKNKFCLFSDYESNFMTKIPPNNLMIIRRGRSPIPTSCAVYTVALFPPAPTTPSPAT